MSTHSLRVVDAVDAVDMVEAGCRVPGAICIARNRLDQWVAYALCEPVVGDECLYLEETALRRDGTPGMTRSRQTLSQRAVNRMLVVWSGDDWARWRRAAYHREWPDMPANPPMAATKHKTRSTTDTVRTPNTNALRKALIVGHDPIRTAYYHRKWFGLCKIARTTSTTSTTPRRTGRRKFCHDPMSRG